MAKIKVTKLPFLFYPSYQLELTLACTSWLPITFGMLYKYNDNNTIHFMRLEPLVNKTNNNGK